MPHDRNGKLVKVGDHVRLEGVVDSVSESPEYCNCTVKSPYIAPAQMGFTATLCTQEIEVVEDAAGTALEAAEAAHTPFVPDAPAPVVEIHAGDSGGGKDK